YQHKIAAVIGALRPDPIIPATKALLAHMGYEVGEATYPMKRIAEIDVKALLQRVGEAGWRS
ncbi:MAG: hypothetical protein IJX19_10720, partial [Clostridia bacterium]|nr:hypothetical protein [Clostridia bacterium]